ncbi:hypothetical protein I545_5847 [Mycobacterium kansasii 662]|uniref:Uncharacterized protein n=1 Tax=Mycobacterium kansasii 662 TaxID=1299326 RepID=X7YSV1_MYCKA|nr:hypothetical protein I545_5847 [Mycobacterium kansasii 662]
MRQELVDSSAWCETSIMQVEDVTHVGQRQPCALCRPMKRNLPTTSGV